MNERDVETLIDEQLRNLGWNDDPKNPKRNVYRQAAKTCEQSQSLQGKRPDYVLYRSQSTQPLIVIEAKRPNQDIKKAIDQGKAYARKLNAPICYATDGVYIKTHHLKKNKPLFKNGEEVDEFIRETDAISYINNNEKDTIEQKVIQSRQELIRVFETANKLLRTEGISRGLDRFSEFSNILFLKIFSELKKLKSKGKKQTESDYIYSWDYFREKKGTELLSHVNNVVLKHLREQYKEADIFEQLQIQNPITLEKMIDHLDPLNLTDTNSDIKGDAFEYFLSKYTAKHNSDLGEYFTPRHIVRACVKLINPRLGEKIYDPFCGTGGMLIESFKYIHRSMAHKPKNIDFLKRNTIYGNEITKNARITKMNMILMGDGHNNILKKDSLSNPIHNKYDIVITNMPFAQTTTHGNQYDLPTSNGNSICLQHCIKAIDGNRNGRAAIIVPDGLLENKQYTKLREYIFKKANVKNIVSLPHGVFSPYSNTVKTSILYLTNINQNKRQKQSHYWYFTVKEDGYSFTSQRRRIKGGKNDLDTFIIYRNDNPISLFTKVDVADIGNSYAMIPRSIDDNYKYSTPLGKICFRENRRAGEESGKYEVKTLSNKGGFMDKFKYYKQESQQTTTKHPENYRIVYPNQFAYRVTEGLAIGTVDYNRGTQPILCSAVYPVFSIDTNKVLPEYLYRVLTSKTFKSMAKEMMAGTARPSLPFDVFITIKIPLIPLAEQRKIVNKLDKATTNISILQETIEKHKNDSLKIIDNIWEIEQ